MVGLLTRSWQIRLEHVGDPHILGSYGVGGEVGTDIIMKAQMVLQACSLRDSTAMLYAKNLHLMQQLIG